MKEVLGFVTLMLFVGIASASVGETAGYLYFNFTQTGQTLTNTWTLINTGTNPVPFNISLPVYNHSSLSIHADALSGTIPANSSFPIQVTVTKLSSESFNGMLSALFQGDGNIAFRIDKKLYVNFRQSSVVINATYSVTSTTTSTTTTPTTIAGSSAGAAYSASGMSGLLPSVTAYSCGYRIINFSQEQVVTTPDLNGRKITITENFITPTSAGITIDGKSTEIQIGESDKLGSGYSVQLLNVSWLPSLVTISLLACYQPPATTSSTVSSTSSTTSITTSLSTASSTTTLPTSTIQSTTTVPQTSQGSQIPTWKIAVIIGIILLGVAAVVLVLQHI